MTKEDRIEVFLSAIDLWGEETQFDKAIEEASELIKAIIKYRHKNRSNPEWKKGLISEIADVQNMTEQLILLLGTSEEEIESIQNEKVLKLKTTIETGEY